MSVFGLTGGIGAGKSTVASLFQEAGIPVVFADDVGREVVSKGSEGLSAIVELFGPDLIDDTGNLARRKLGGIGSKDPQKRTRLESILHPLVQNRSRSLFVQLENAGNQIIIYESALLFETNRHTEMHGVILVSASEETRIARVQERDSSNAEDVRRRIQAQMADDDKRKLCEYLIENDGDIERLSAQVARVIPQLVQKSKDSLVLES